MAQKNDFLMPLRYADVFFDLTKEQAGELIQGIFSYESTLQIPEFRDGEVRVAFKCIKTDLDFNREKYAAKINANSKNGALGGRPGNPKKRTVFEKTQKSERFLKKPKKAVYDYVVVNDNDYDNDKDLKDKDSCPEQQTTVATAPVSELSHDDFNSESFEAADEGQKSEIGISITEKAAMGNPITGEVNIPDELEGLSLYMADEKLCKRWPELISAWKESCPGIDIRAETAKAHAWETSNPKKRKIDRPRFLFAWLCKAQDQSGGKVIGGRTMETRRERDVGIYRQHIEKKLKGGGYGIGD